uniref:Uncharacterized protein n=1 Tax=Rhizophora mucronata TaxID=61149 RepID=A0A2P2J027_RHIMU
MMCFFSGCIPYSLSAMCLDFSSVLFLLLGIW